jgi:hypothetical protein
MGAAFLRLAGQGNPINPTRRRGSGRFRRPWLIRPCHLSARPLLGKYFHAASLSANIGPNVLKFTLYFWSKLCRPIVWTSVWWRKHSGVVLPLSFPPVALVGSWCATTSPSQPNLDPTLQLIAEINFK